MATMSTEVMREEVLKLEQELRMRAWHEQQLAIADGNNGQIQEPAGLVIEVQTLKYTNGDDYEGEVLDTLRHGDGRHTCSNGDIYDGAWNFDKRHGRGTATFASGLRYEGQWREDMANGSGRATYQNGGSYEGDFQSDHRWGWGKHTFPDGTTYEGEWFDDIIEGRGRFTYGDGSFFEGEVGNGRRVKGKFVSSDGSCEYDGGWSQDLQHGTGVMSQRGEWKYTGSWEAGQQSGHGVCEYLGGIRYEGGWKLGVRSWQGTLRGPAYQYEGAWANDRQHGQGKCHMESGDKYSGGWQQGERHGDGSCAFVNGDKFCGQWAEGARNGQGACEYANGDLYQGEWRNDQRHGTGSCRFADGTKFRGQWQHDGWVQSAGCPARSRALLSPDKPHSAVAGKQSSFTIQARDDLGNKRLSGGDACVVQLRGSCPVVEASVEDGGDGRYTATFCTTSAGDQLIHVMLGKEKVAGSPYLAHITAAEASPRHSTTTGDGTTCATAGCTATFTVQVRDRFGNRCCSEPALRAFQLEAALSCDNMKCPVAVEQDVTSGELRCSYSAAAPGRWRLLLTSQGAHLRDSPFSVKVTVTSAQPAESDTAAVTLHPATCDSVSPAATAEESTEVAKAAKESQDAPPVDESRLWAALAKASFACDGATEGWESSDDEGSKPTGEDTYLKAHPGVPVVENLEDLWMVSKLQRQRKEAEAAKKRTRLDHMKAALQQQLGEPLAAPQPTGVDSHGTLITAPPAVPGDGNNEASLVPMPLTLPAARW